MACLCFLLLSDGGFSGIVTVAIDIQLLSRLQGFMSQGHVLIIDDSAEGRLNHSEVCIG